MRETCCALCERVRCARARDRTPPAARGTPPWRALERGAEGAQGSASAHTVSEAAKAKGIEIHFGNLFGFMVETWGSDLSRKVLEAVS